MTVFRCPFQIHLDSNTVRLGTSRKLNFLLDNRLNTDCPPTELGSSLCGKVPTLVFGRKTVAALHAVGRSSLIFGGDRSSSDLISRS